MSDHSVKQYSVQFGPRGQDAAQLRPLIQESFLSNAWSALFCQPLALLLTDPHTGRSHQEPMQWRLYDEVNKSELLSIYSQIGADPKILLHYGENMFRNFVQGLPAGQLPSDDILLATWDTNAAKMQFQPAYQVLASAAFEVQDNPLVLGSQLPFRINYDTTRLLDHRQVHSKEWHYFPSLTTAANSLLLNSLSNLSENKLPVASPFRFTDIAVLEHQQSRPALQIYQANHKAILACNETLINFQKKTALDFVNFEGYAPKGNKVVLGEFDPKKGADILPSKALREMRTDMLMGVARSTETPEQSWQYKVKYHIPMTSDNLASNLWVSAHEQDATSALQRFLQINFVNLHDDNRPHVPYAEIQSASGWPKVTLETVNIDYNGVAEATPPWSADYRMNIDLHFLDKLPPQVRSLVPGLNMPLASLEAGALHWTPEAVQLRTTLYHYNQSLQLLNTQLKIASLESLHRPDGTYTLQVHHQPASFDCRQPQPPIVTQQVKLSDFGAALNALTAFPLHNLLPADLSNKEATVRAITLFSERQRSPLVMATGVYHKGEQQAKMHIRVDQSALTQIESGIMRSRSNPVTDITRFEVTYMEGLKNYRAMAGLQDSTPQMRQKKGMGQSPDPYKIKR